MKREFAFWIVITIFVIVLVLALNQRYGFVERVMFAPTTLPKIGSSGASAASGDCCLCVYDSSEERFKPECQTWLDEQKECAVKKLVSIDSTDSQCWQKSDCGNAFSPGECSGREMRIQYHGHSFGSLCKPFADKVFQVCVNSGSSCANVVNSGCLTFENYLDALIYISELSAITGVTAKISANQCVVYGAGKRCVQTTESMCTISVDASCSRADFAPCNFGEWCGWLPGCESAYCYDDVSQRVVKEQCCSDDERWHREGECSACNGACCTWPKGSADMGTNFCFDSYTGGIDSHTCPPNPNYNIGKWFPDQRCSQDICPYLAQGTCCVEYKDGNQECLISVTYDQCYAFIDTPYEDKDVVAVKWDRNETCSDNSCSAITGACCTIDSCALDDPYTCYDDLTFQQCKAKEAENPLCVRAQWGFEKKCTDMNCAKEGCRIDFPDAYIGPSCDTCKRNFCSLYEIMSGGCYSWCSSYDTPDDFGNYCCGPA